MQSSDLTLCINAGGRGLRLGGAAKGLLRVGGRTVMERLLDLRPLASAVVLVANDPAPYSGFGLQAVPDALPGKGAPGGVVTALAESKTPWVLVVACDMPFVTPAVVGPLLEAAGDDVDVALYERDGRLEPMVAVYRTALLAPFRDALAADPSLQSLVRGVRYQALTPADPAALNSLNTEADVAAAQRLKL